MMPACLSHFHPLPPQPLAQRMMATLAALRRRSRAPSQPGAGGSRKGTQSGGGRRASASPSQRASVSAAAQQEAE